MARRKKKDDDIIKQLFKKADEAKKTGIALSKIAAKEAQLRGKELSKEAQIRGKELSKEGKKRLDECVAAAKQKMSSSDEHLKTLEKLGKLKKAGIISDKEFQAKKKEILKRI